MAVRVQTSKWLSVWAPEALCAGNPDSCLAHRSWALGPDPGQAAAVSGVPRSCEEAGEMAGTRGCLPVVSEAVNTSWAAKAQRGPGAGARGSGLEGLTREVAAVLRVWERKHSPVLG